MLGKSAMLPAASTRDCEDSHRAVHGIVEERGYGTAVDATVLNVDVALGKSEAELGGTRRAVWGDGAGDDPDLGAEAAVEVVCRRGVDVGVSEGFEALQSSEVRDGLFVVRVQVRGEGHLVSRLEGLW